VNPRQRRRQRRRIAEDPELYALRGNTVIAAVVVIAVLLLEAVVVVALGGWFDVLGAVAVCGAVTTALVARHTFRVRLAVRRQEWFDADPSAAIREDIADAFDVPDELVAPPPAPGPDAETRAYFEHEFKPHAEFVARQLTDFMHREGSLPPSMTLRLPGSTDDVLDGYESRFGGSDV
jgi:hypothetical protein